MTGPFPHESKRSAHASRGEAIFLRSGSALVVMLACLALVTVLTVALLSMAQTERRTASLAMSRSQAQLLASMAADLAMARISDAIVQGSQPDRTWASEPGRIWIFDIVPGSGAVNRRYVEIFSGLPGPDDPQVRDRYSVDLNTPNLKGGFPIAPPAPGNTAATMKVGWKNILRDPSQPASATNPIVGRIAYWADDESCKVNINTADGSRKGNDGHYGGFPTASPANGYSFGFGTPSEISLAGLPGLDQNQARAIADTAWAQEFLTAGEIVRAKNPDGSQAVDREDFERLRFDITHHNSSPDLNFLGEPRIHLLRAIMETGTASRLNAVLGPNRLPAAMGGSGLSGLPMDHIYPQPSQLTAPPFLSASQRFAMSIFSVTAQRISPTDLDYGPGSLLANYLSGVNQRGQQFTWPVFPGSSSAGFRGKYTDRQLDSMVLQMIETPGRSAFCDEVNVSSLPYMATSGWLSNQPVMGIGRIHFPTEILMVVNLGLGDLFGSGTEHPTFQMQLYTEQYWPKGHAGMPNHQPYDAATQNFVLYGTRIGSPGLGTVSVAGTMNFYDLPAISNSGSVSVTGPGALGTTWMDRMLRAEDGSGGPAGIDFFGTPKEYADPDQARAELLHPYTERADGTFHGSVANPSNAVRYYPLLQMDWGTVGRGWSAAAATVAQSPRFPGTYVSVRNAYPTQLRGAKTGLTELHFKGGLQFWVRNQGSDVTQATPFPSIIPERMNIGTPSGTLDMVLPVDFAVSVPGSGSYLLRSRDPLVNLFPGDWEALTDPASAEITLRIPGTNPNSYARGGTSIMDPSFAPQAPVVNRALDNFDGDNPGFRPQGGGDPLSVWMPRLDNRIPRQARFPSVGALFSMRTGLFPDKSLDAAAPQQQAGVPFRGLNMAPSSQPSQGTQGGSSYPDWVLLDFVTVPFLPTKPYGPATSTAATQPFRRLTHGGATIGRININNPPVPFPFGENPAINPQPPRRNALNALFFNLRPSNSYDSNGDPVYTTIDAAKAAELTEAVAAYQRTNGPFFLQGEIANVPAVADFLYTFSAQSSGPSRTASISRNDLVRDVVGAITTRSNTYSVWVVAQTIKKRPGNTNHGEYEPGDQITSEVRRRYLVERFMDTGQDGVPGNAVDPSLAGTPNTYVNTPAARQSGDPSNSSAPFWHPNFQYPLPYRWRTLLIENLSL